MRLKSGVDARIVAKVLRLKLRPAGVPSQGHRSVHPHMVQMIPDAIHNLGRDLRYVPFLF